MTDLSSIKRGFDYDLWANSKWLQCLLGKGFPSPDSEIFAHIFGAQQIWLTRLHGESLTALPKIEPIASELERLHDGWIKVLDSTTEDQIITYQRTTGEENSLSVIEIARHVINHGTYHRGELRGLCRSRGDADFPESDYAAFAFLSRRG